MGLSHPKILDPPLMDAPASVYGLLVCQQGLEFPNNGIFIQTFCTTSLIVVSECQSQFNCTVARSPCSSIYRPIGLKTTFEPLIALEYAKLNNNFIGSSEYYATES